MYALEGLGGEDGQNGLDFLVEVEELVLLDLGCGVYAGFFGFVRCGRLLVLKLVGLDLYGYLRWGLRVWILEEEVQIGLYFGVGCGLDIIRCHFLLVFAEVGELVLHVLILQFLLLPVDVDLLLLLHCQASHILLAEHPLVLLLGFLLNGFPVFGLQFHHLRHCLEPLPLTLLRLTLHPSIHLLNPLPLAPSHLLDHAGPILQPVQLHIIHHILQRQFCIQL